MSRRIVPNLALNRRLTVAVGLWLACGGLPCRGPAAEPPRSHLEPAGAVTGGPPTVASLGLTLTRASAVLRRQLALRRGAGLVVEGVAAHSRAASAGFAQHDVLVKLDDQLLLLPEQFDALLESAEPDAPLDCTVLRGGREVVIPLVKASPIAGRPPRSGATSGGLRPTASSLALVQQAVPRPPAPRPGAIDASRLRRLADETLVRQDSDFQIRLTSGEQTRLVVSDSQGLVVFNDTIDTPEGRSRMPAQVRDRVTDMERMLEGRDARTPPPAEVGRLDVAPVELR
jgi:hypothetical protein